MSVIQLEGSNVLAARSSKSTAFPAFPVFFLRPSHCVPRCGRLSAVFQASFRRLSGGFPAAFRRLSGVFQARDLFSLKKETVIPGCLQPQLLCRQEFRYAKLHRTKISLLVRCIFLLVESDLGGSVTPVEEVVGGVSPPPP